MILNDLIESVMTSLLFLFQKTEKTFWKGWIDWDSVLGEKSKEIFRQFKSNSSHKEASQILFIIQKYSHISIAIIFTTCKNHNFLFSNYSWYITKLIKYWFRMFCDDLKIIYFWELALYTLFNFYTIRWLLFVFHYSLRTSMGT